jgi:hypothetical protein
MKKIVNVIAVLFLALGILIFRPVPISSESRSNKVTGTVKSIYEGGVKDVVFQLNETDTKYYINRGLESGLNLETLRDQLMGREVTIVFPKYWTPLDPGNSVKHLTRLVFNEVIVYSEIDN